MTVQWRLRANASPKQDLDDERATDQADAERVSTPTRGIATNQLTIRGLDEQLATYVRDFARREGISLNSAVIQLLRRGAELDQSKADVVGSSVDHLMGTWTTEEANRIDQALEDFSRIDEAMWK